LSFLKEAFVGKETEILSAESLITLTACNLDMVAHKLDVVLQLISALKLGVAVVAGFALWAI
jgi:hypothetical protein